MKTRVTFPHPISRVTVAEVRALFTAAGVAVVVSSASCDGNLLIITTERHLSAQEKATVATVFRLAFPRIEDVPEA